LAPITSRPIFSIADWPLRVVAAGQDDFSTGFGQSESCLVTETARGPRDNGGPAELRRDFALCRTSHGSTLLNRSSHFRKTKAQ
jgi:hypothetical protein